MIRAVMLVVSSVSSLSRSSGKIGVRSSKRRRWRASSGSCPLTSSMRSSAGFFSLRRGRAARALDLVALAQPELADLLHRDVEVVLAREVALAGAGSRSRRRGGRARRPRRPARPRRASSGCPAAARPAARRGALGAVTAPATAPAVARLALGSKPAPPSPSAPAALGPSALSAGVRCACWVFPLPLPPFGRWRRRTWAGRSGGPGRRWRSDRAPGCRQPAARRGRSPRQGRPDRRRPRRRSVASAAAVSAASPESLSASASAVASASPSAGRRRGTGAGRALGPSACRRRQPRRTPGRTARRHRSGAAPGR